MADGYWEILHSCADIKYTKGGKDAGKTKFLAQMKVLLMLTYDWFNVFSLRQDLKQHSGSTKEHFKWALALLTKIIGFPVETIFKFTKVPLEITHRYQGNMLKTFSGDPTTENKVSSQEIGGINGIVAMFDYDEPTSNKIVSDEQIKVEQQWWRIAMNSNMERGLEFATQEMLDWQSVYVVCNPWQPNSSFDQLYATPFIFEDREELKKILTTKYKFKKMVETPEYSILIMITNAMIIEEILEQTPAGRKQIAKCKHYFNATNISGYDETFYIGINGYIEGGVYEYQRESIVYKDNLAQLYSNPIAMAFGVDYANKQDKMVLSVLGYTNNYQNELKYADYPIAPKEHRNEKFRDIFIANKYVEIMLTWLRKMNMPKHITWRCSVDGDFFRQTLEKCWMEKFKYENDEELKYTILFKEKENLKVQTRVKDDKELMATGRLIVDKDMCDGWIQEVNTIRWSSDKRSALDGNDDNIQATHYARDPYRNKLMKGERKYETI